MSPGNEYFDFDKSSDLMNNKIINEFGTSYSDNLTITYDYNINSKELTITGDNDCFRYNISIGSRISAASGITEHFILHNKVKDVPISFEKIVKINTKMEIIDNILNTENINIWKSPGSDIVDIKFRIEDAQHKKTLIELRKLIELYWNNLNIEEHDSIYILNTTNIELNALFKGFNTILDNLICLSTKWECIVDDITYTLIANNYFYFVLRSKLVADEDYEDDIYDWGIIDLPKFINNGNPIFNVTISQANLVYGINTNYSLEFH